MIRQTHAPYFKDKNLRTLPDLFKYYLNNIMIYYDLSVKFYHDII